MNVSSDVGGPFADPAYYTMGGATNGRSHEIRHHQARCRDWQQGQLPKEDAVEIIPLKWDDLNVKIENLGAQLTEGKTSTTYGIASFPAGVRHPQEGYSAHEGIEVSFILEGEFEVETPLGVVSVSRDSLVVIPAGEPHATRATASGRVAYFLINEIQE
jgi:mannose-6-phosphate isomerase-like protein (cupin superfamily)